MKLIYLAGPITKPSPFQNVVNAIKIADTLIDAGFAVFVPHLYFFQEKLGKKRDNGKYNAGYEVWMHIDFAVIERCDALFRIAGFSLGADKEEAYAKSLGKPIFTSLEAMAQHFTEDNALD